MNKDLWKRSVTAHGCPDWPCPVCNAGLLVLDKGTLVSVATKASMRDSHEDWWGLEHVILSFTAWAECSNKTCGERFSLAGRGSVEEDPDEYGERQHVEVFDLKYCQPTLRIIAWSENCPEAVVDALHAACALYWIDGPAAAARIRVAVERLLDHLGIASKNGNGGRLPLDARINSFAKTDPTHGPQLMALKWLGNVGAHTPDVNTDDLLSAFEVMEHVLAEVIDKRSEAAAKAAAELTKKYMKK
jgi:hypothetical protein